MKSRNHRDSLFFAVLTTLFLLGAYSHQSSNLGALLEYNTERVSAGEVWRILTWGIPSWIPYLYIPFTVLLMWYTSIELRSRYRNYWASLLVFYLTIPAAAYLVSSSLGVSPTFSGGLSFLFLFSGLLTLLGILEDSLVGSLVTHIRSHTWPQIALYGLVGTVGVVSALLARSLSLVFLILFYSSIFNISLYLWFNLMLKKEA